MKQFLTALTPYTVAITVLAVTLTLGYIAYLETGCDGHDAIMTWQGKMCEIEYVDIISIPSHPPRLDHFIWYPDGSYLDTLTGQVGCADSSKGCTPSLD